MIVNHGNGSVVNNLENTIIIKSKFRHNNSLKNHTFLLRIFAKRVNYMRDIIKTGFSF